MSLPRAMKPILGWVVLALVIVPIVAVPMGATIDIGLGGTGRVTAFHLVLAASDHSAKDAIRNSLILAAAVTAISLAVGVGLGRLLAGPRTSGRDALFTLAMAPGAVPPLIAAVGISSLGRFVPSEWDAMWRWVALGWVELAWAIPQVAAVASGAFSKVAPAMVDAARLAGAGQRRAWRTAVWPLGRPLIARTLAEVFGLVLFEPGGPIVLGVRGTLGFRLVEAVLAGDRIGRAAALGTFGLVLALVGRSLILGWGGPSWTMSDRPAPRLVRGRSWFGTLASGLVLSAWTVLGLIPTAALLANAFGVDRHGRVTLGAFLALIADRDALTSLGVGVLLSLSATGLALGIALLLGRGGGRPTWQSPSSWVRAVPPLAFGLGVAALPSLIDAGAWWLPERSAGLLHRLADALDPFRSPWTVLVLSVGMLRMPDLRAAIDSVAAIDDRVQVEVARTLGASPREAWRSTSAPRVATVLGGAVAWSIAAAALDAGPALLLSPTLAARPIAPAVWAITLEPDATIGRASAMAVVAMLLPIGAWIVGGSRRARTFRP